MGFVTKPAFSLSIRPHAQAPELRSPVTNLSYRRAQGITPLTGSSTLKA
jgi:hypothetical protein